MKLTDLPDYPLKLAESAQKREQIALEPDRLWSIRDMAKRLGVPPSVMRSRVLAKDFPTPNKTDLEGRQPLWLQEDVDIVLYRESVRLSK